MGAKKKKVSFFVVVFDRTVRRMVTITTFEEDDEAMAALFEAEDQYLSRANNRYEVVLLGAESVDDLHKTHSRYFAESPEDREYLIAL